MTRIPSIFIAVCMITIASNPISSLQAVEVEPLIKSIREVSPQGEGHPEAVAAMRALSQADAKQLPQVLAGMDGANKLATNWLRGAAEAVAQRAVSQGGTLPIQRLEEFLLDTRHSPQSRRLAYELVLQVDKTAQRRLIPKMLNDPALELRRDAVAMAIKSADAWQKKGNDMSVAAYRNALAAARDLDQIDAIAKKLDELGATVDLPTYFGFIMQMETRWAIRQRRQEGFRCRLCSRERPEHLG